MKYKEFNGSRVCAIDFQPLLIEAIRETVSICKKYNIPLTSVDVKKFFYHYCLEKFCSVYQKCPSKYPKALVVYDIPKGIPFTNKNLDKVLKVLPIPWCRCHSFDSSDVEMAATNAVNKSKSREKMLNSFANKNQLFSFLNDFKKSKHFSAGSVDFDSDRA